MLLQLFHTHHMHVYIYIYMCATPPHSPTVLCAEQARSGSTCQVFDGNARKLLTRNKGAPQFINEKQESFAILHQGFKKSPRPISRNSNKKHLLLQKNERAPLFLDKKESCSTLSIVNTRTPLNFKRNMRKLFYILKEIR